MRPRCPLVVSLPAPRPRPAYVVARALTGDHLAACTTLARLERAELVRRQGWARRVEYTLTARGRRELRLQRLLWGMWRCRSAADALNVD